MKRLLIAAALTLWMAADADADAFAGNPGRAFAYNGFSGGMMVHTGWVGSNILPLNTPSGEALPKQRIGGMPYGLGGSLRFHFGDHLRAGGEGYGTYLEYGHYGSRIGVGWGGVSLDWQWHAGRFHPYAGLTLGGGTVRNLTLAEPAPNDSVTENNASYRRYGFIALAPFAGVEFALSHRMRLVLKADWLVNAGRRQPDFPGGVRLYVGFVFCHLRAE